MVNWLSMILILGGITFEGQDIASLHVTRTNILTGQASVDFRQGDFNGDTHLDLMFEDSVVFQENERFHTRNRVDLPVFKQPHIFDLWQGTLFVRLPERLQTFTWENNDWQIQLDQELQWTSKADKFSGETFRVDSTHLHPFLFDLDEDQSPEIILIDEGGVLVFAREKGLYVCVAQLDLLPPLVLEEMPGQKLWPPESRYLYFPARHMACRFYMEGHRINRLIRDSAPEGGGEGGITFRHTTFPLKADSLWTVQQEAIREVSTEIMPSFLEPCALNRDKTMDYAGGRWVQSEVSPLPKSLYETWATLDGGKNFYVQRAPSFANFRPRCAFVDFDGDGDMDMVTESTGLFDGGIRETLNRLRTSRRILHTVQVFRQAQGQFSRKPALKTQLLIQLAHPPYRRASQFQRYISAELVDISGDFNGDGYRDLAVQEAPGLLSIYLAAGFGYPKNPDIRVPIKKNAKFNVFDVNGDGWSDVVLHWTEVLEESNKAGKSVYRQIDHSKVLFAEESAP
jgi:hypothetical protein